LEYGLPPDLPKIAKQEVLECEKSGDYRPVLFEWYQYAGLLTNFVASVRQISPCVKEVPRVQFIALKGLLNRISRLMLSNVALSHEGRFGETTLIVDRCIFESAVKIIWLTGQSSPESTHRYLADGLKSELELRAIIEKNIAQRSGQVMPIEARMIGAIDNSVLASGLSNKEVLEAKRIPSVAAILTAIGHSRLDYVVAMKVGSHAVHGTWPSLLSHYLEQGESGEFQPRDADCETDFNQYVYVSFMVLYALENWIAWALTDAVDSKTILDRCSGAREAIGVLFEAAVTSKEAMLAKVS
jgi:hypothetical protein